MHDGPRKVILTSLMYGPYDSFPGLEQRLSELSRAVDRMVEAAGRVYPGRRVDLVALPEYIVCGGLEGTAEECSVLLEGPVFDMFARKAREHQAYITVPLNKIEDADRGVYHNSIGLVDRSGRLVGVYHKYHVTADEQFTSLEGGMTPGTEFPVFDCDFGRVGFQICYDINFDTGWKSLKESGAEIVVWSTQSPQTARPAAIALAQRYYILSSTWRNNLSLFEPTGTIAAQVLEPADILVAEIDLSYLIIPWSRRLRNGEYVKERYGDRMGYRYYEAEDVGIFWSNDPEMPIAKLTEEDGLVTVEEERRRGLELIMKKRKG